LCTIKSHDPYIYQIGKLESEVSLLHQELNHERDEKTAIQTQVDSFSSKLLQLQSQTLDGNTAIVDLKVIPVKLVSIADISKLLI